MFITMLPHLDPMMFYLATQQNAQTQAVAGAEKTAVAWCVVQPPACKIEHSHPGSCSALSRVTSLHVMHASSRIFCAHMCLMAVKGEAGGSYQGDCTTAGAVFLESDSDCERAPGREEARPQRLPLHAVAPMLCQHHTSSSGKLLLAI